MSAFNPHRRKLRAAESARRVLDRALAWYMAGKVGPPPNRTEYARARAALAAAGQDAEAYMRQEAQRRLVAAGARRAAAAGS